MISVTRLNESFSLIQGTEQELIGISNFYKVEREGAYFDPLVKRGFKSPYDFFTTKTEVNGVPALLIMNGLVELNPNLSDLAPEIENTGFSEEEIQEVINDIQKNLPFTYYEYQSEGVLKTLTETPKRLSRYCTGQGKSIIISTIIEFFRRKGLKGILLVPNINLLTQFYNDIEEYGLEELHKDTEIIGGDRSVQNISELSKSLTISTWQSMQNFEGSFEGLDFVITDETHRFASEQTSQIVQKTINQKYKLGFTGTFPDDKSKMMTLIGLFGAPKTHIRTQELIELGLGTPLNVNSIILQYDKETRDTIRGLKQFQRQFKYLRELEARNDFITRLSTSLKGNTLVLFGITDHGKDLFTRIFLQKYPEFKGREKEILITGKKSFDFQKEYNVYFINGEDDAKTREKTRNILEESEDALLIANYAILSTGANIRKLHNLVLASPLKSFTTISQSIGRLVRLHPSKTEANIYDIVDDLGVRKYTGVFWNQYQERVNKSYNPEAIPITERVLTINAQGS